MTFVFTYNLLQIPNVAWQSYLQLTLHFPAWILGLTVILGSFMTFAGILAYKNFFFKSSWRSIYVGTMCLTTFFSLMQLVLIFQLNTKIGVHNYFFSLGDDVITAYIAGIQFLPVCIMYMRLCPDGAEGTSYSMLTTFGNIALVCASNLGILLAGFFDVSNAALRSGDVSGIWKLSLLTSALALLPLLWLHLLPNSPEEQDALAKSQERSKLAGTVFLSVLVGSLVWTSTSAVLNVLAA
ncbi:BT1 family-domain-containing protein [Ochromonadaceae sp. CCMP2298]|nr:BT1 family-domain-containing protein [Ochromonadaceae sp. CCMP2298]